MSKRICKGDQVVVITGNDRGKVGQILSFKGEEHVIVEGVNVRKKHMKKSGQTPGRIIDIECSIHLSNVRLFIDNQAVKLHARTDKKGEKELYYLKDGNPVGYRSGKEQKK